MRRNHLMDVLGRIWLCMGHKFATRPFTVICVILGITILCIILAFAVIKADSADDKATRITRQLCNSSSPYTNERERNCRILLDRLLRNPTPAQVERLRKLIKETP